MSTRRYQEVQLSALLILLKQVAYVHLTAPGLHRKKNITLFK